MKLFEATSAAADVIRKAGSTGNDLTPSAQTRVPILKLEIATHPFQLIARSGMVYMVPGSVHLGMCALNIPLQTVSTAGLSNTTTYYVFLKIALKAAYQGVSAGGVSFSNLFEFSLHLSSQINPSSLNPVSTRYPWGNPYVLPVVLGMWRNNIITAQYVSGNMQIQGRFGYVIV